MTAAISITTVADAISKISVTGVTIKDIDEIPQNVSNRDCPILYPRPDGFISGLEVENVSLGSGASRQIDLSYTLTYTYLHSKIGTDRGLFVEYPEMIASLEKIVNAIIANDSVTGAVDVVAFDIVGIGAVHDPSGDTFHGFDIIIGIEEIEN